MSLNRPGSHNPRRIAANVALAVGLVAGALVAQTSAPGTAEIQGFVVDDAGKPIRGALVSYVRTYAPPDAKAISPQPTVSAKDGSFTLRAVSLGTYRLCSQLPGSDLLNPCEWGSRVPTVNITSAEIYPGLRVSMEHGTVAHIRIDDPGSLLPKLALGQHQNDVIVGIWTPRGFRDVPVGVQDSGGKTHFVSVPYGQAVKVTLISPSLKLADGAGSSANTFAASASGADSTIQANRGDPEPMLRFKITGR